MLQATASGSTTVCPNCAAALPKYQNIDNEARQRISLDAVHDARYAGSVRWRQISCQRPCRSSIFLQGGHKLETDSVWCLYSSSFHVLATREQAERRRTFEIDASRAGRGSQELVTWSLALARVSPG